MPVYQFKCDVCGVTFEKRFHMTDDKSNVVCPNGHTKVHQIHPVPYIIFKGSGFYVNDNRPESHWHTDDGDGPNREVSYGNCS